MVLSIAPKKGYENPGKAPKGKMPSPQSMKKSMPMKKKKK